MPPGGTSVSDGSVAAAESVILRLRTAAGVDPSELGEVGKWALASGLLERSADRVRLTRRGRLLSNELFAGLMPHAEEVLA